MRAYVLRASAAAASMITGSLPSAPPPSILGEEDAADFDPGPATAEAAAAAGGGGGGGLSRPGVRCFCCSLRRLCNSELRCLCCWVRALRCFRRWPGAATTTGATPTGGGVAAGSEGWGCATAKARPPPPPPATGMA